MISAKTLSALEFNKVLQDLSGFAVLEKTKLLLAELNPTGILADAEKMLNTTEEAYTLLYKHSVAGLFYFSDIEDELRRADLGGTLTIAEILKIASSLKSARIAKTSILSINDEKIIFLKDLALRLFINSEFEKEVSDKIISEDELSDNASSKLYSIRKSIRNINAKIREQLASYMRGSLGKYAQDHVVTIRQDRYVVPIKSEYRSFVKGFIHDQSSTGSTVFIEPEQIMELNNELKKAMFDEAEEVRRILFDLSQKIASMSDSIRYNIENLVDLDSFYARAQYAFKNKCSKPLLNDKGIMNIKRGRHPLIDKNKVVPIDIQFGKDYNFLLISGPNTGGKTVTLKLTGLFSIMAMCGMYIPADDDCEVSIFNNVFCDIGDEQSIEQSLSTFSSHITNIIKIINENNNKSLVLLDEIGAGTDPEEGSALALAIINELLKTDCFGIITTHYSKLKVFAMDNPRIQNAAMEFDSSTLMPLYKLNIGIPGSSNALDIAKTLGLKPEIIEDALANMSDDKIGFEKVLKKAEESRRDAERLIDEYKLKLKQKQDEIDVIEDEKKKIIAERERIYHNARQETKRIVADKLSEAEEIIEELKNILKRADLESKQIFKAGELKNRLKNSRYLVQETDHPFELKKVNLNELKQNCKVYVKSIGSYAKFIALKKNGKEAEVLIGDIKTVVKKDDLYNSEQEVIAEEKINVNRDSKFDAPKTEINVIGKDSIEATIEVQNFIDQAVVNGLSEIKIIHGVGQGILLKAIRQYLKTHAKILEFRRGNYGEGENGVTIVKLK